MLILSRILSGIFALVVLLCAGVAVFVFSSYFSQNSVKSAQNAQTFSEYNDDMEHKLCSVISAINGVGQVSVAISYGSGIEKIYAYETKTQTTGNVKTENSSVITVGGQALVVKELAPSVSGVVVVAEGANDVAIRLKIVEAVTTLLNIDGNKVQVFF